MIHSSPQIYRCDHILGLTESELCPELYRSWGQSFAEMLPENVRLVVTSDGRAKAEYFQKALIEGLLSAPIQILDMQALPNDLASYASIRMNAIGYISVGAGQKSASWNGLKWRIHSDQTIAGQIQKLMGDVASFDPIKEIPALGTVRNLDIISDWTAWLQTVWFDTPSVPWRVLIDPLHGNWSGIARCGLQAVFPHIVFESIHDVLQPNFNCMIPDSDQSASIAELCSQVDLQRMNLGLALSSNANHFTLIDDQGAAVRPEEILWSVIHDLLNDALEGETFLHDTNCSEKIIAEGIRLGGRAKVVPANENAFIETMNREDALIGLGSNGDIYFRGAQGHRIALFAFCWFLDFFARSNLSVSQWRSSIPAFYTTSEIRTPIVSLQDVSARLERLWKIEPKTTIDGIRFTLSRSRVNIRTIPDYSQLGFHFESQSRQELQDLLWQCACHLDDLDNIGLFMRQNQ